MPLLNLGLELGEEMPYYSKGGMELKQLLLNLSPPP